MRITVKLKLILGFSVLIILLAIIGVVGIVNLNRINMASRFIHTQMSIADYTRQVEIAVLECRRAEKNFCCRRDNKYIGPVKEGVVRIKDNLTLIKKGLGPTSGFIPELNNIDRLADEYCEEFLKSARLTEFGTQGRVVFDENSSFAVIARQIHALVPPLAKKIRMIATEETKRAGAIREKSIIMIVATIGISIAIGLLLALLISYNIGSSIGALMQTMRRVRKGDLGARVHIKSKDEIGRLGDYFNEMVTDLKDLQQQVVNAERLASLGRLAAGVAHEINSPLTGVLTFSHLLLKKAAQDDPQREKLEVIVEEATNCRRIIQGLLDFARQTEPEIAPADINEIVEGALSLVENLASFHNIKIVKELDQSLPQISIDANQIQQVFMNIILNAQEAMPDGGFLTVSSSFSDKDQSIEVKFIDTGCGIPQENLDKLFDPFFTTKEVGKGTGLGLAVSYGIIGRHQGSLKVHSTVGKGTTFIVKLPIQAPKPSPNQERSEVSV